MFSCDRVVDKESEFKSFNIVLHLRRSATEIVCFINIVFDNSKYDCKSQEGVNTWWEPDSHKWNNLSLSLKYLICSPTALFLLRILRTGKIKKISIMRPILPQLSSTWLAGLTPPPEPEPSKGLVSNDDIPTFSAVGTWTSMNFRSVQRPAWQVSPHSDISVMDHRLLTEKHRGPDLSLSVCQCHLSQSPHTLSSPDTDYWGFSKASPRTIGEKNIRINCLHISL